MVLPMDWHLNWRGCWFLTEVDISNVLLLRALPKAPVAGPWEEDSSFLVSTLFTGVFIQGPSRPLLSGLLLVKTKQSSNLLHSATLNLHLPTPFWTCRSTCKKACGTIWFFKCIYCLSLNFILFIFIFKSYHIETKKAFVFSHRTAVCTFLGVESVERSELALCFEGAGLQGIW